MDDESEQNQRCHARNDDQKGLNFGRLASRPCPYRVDRPLRSPHEVWFCCDFLGPLVFPESSMWWSGSEVKLIIVSRGF
ncbi:hypothetical protein ACFX12_025126 [Malus domestica]